MFQMLLGPVLEKIFSVVDKSVTDKDLAAKIKSELATQDHEKWLKELESIVQQNTQQAAINLEDAKSQDWFQRRWRPFIGWGCGIAFLWNAMGVHLANTMLTVTALLFDVDVSKVQIAHMAAADSNMMFELLLAVLGLGGMRTFERIKGKI